MTNAQPLKQSEPQVEARHFEVPSRWFFEEDCRFDATTYAQDGYESIRALEESGFRTVSLGTLVGRVYHPTESQPRSNFKRIWVKRGAGPAFLTGKQLFFFRPDQEKFVSRGMPKLNELQLPQGTILLSRSGTTGHPVLVGRWLAQFAVTDDAIRIFQGSAPSGYIYAFLASSVGRPLVVKSEYGGTVSHLEAKHVYKVPVPLVNRSDQEAIHNRILKAYEIRDSSNELLDEADRRLHELLGVSPFSEEDIEYLGETDDPRAFSTTSGSLNSRLDATHHVPVVRSVIHKLGNGAFGLTKLGKRVDRIYVAPRTARVWVEEEFGTPFLQGSHLPMLTPVGLKCISNTETDRLDRWIIRSGWVLVTCSGTIGRVALATNQQDRWAASQHILRIIPDDRDLHPGFLAAFLATPFGQHQLKAKIYGGVVDELTESDTAAIAIPDIHPATRAFDVQGEIGKLVVRAYEMRDEANFVEKEAVGSLEKLIRRNA